MTRWSAADLAEAARLRRGGLSSAQISRAMGRTRNSVVGALHRAGEPGLLVNQEGAKGHGKWARAEPRAVALRAFSWGGRDGSARDPL